MSFQINSTFRKRQLGATPGSKIGLVYGSGLKSELCLPAWCIIHYPFHQQLRKAELVPHPPEQSLEILKLNMTFERTQTRDLINICFTFSAVVWLVDNYFGAIFILKLDDHSFGRNLHFVWFFGRIYDELVPHIRRGVLIGIVVVASFDHSLCIIGITIGCGLKLEQLQGLLVVHIIAFDGLKLNV